MTALDMRGAVIPLALIAVAELWARAVDLQSDSLAAPSAIFMAGAKALASGEMLAATGETLVCALGGLAIGFVLGAFTGILLGIFRALDHLSEVTFELLRPIPSVALIPVAMLIFGFGYWTETSIVAFTTFWPGFLLTRAAVRGVEPRLFEVVRSLEMNLPDTIRKIVVPAVLPRMFVALRLAAGISLIVAVTVEITANPVGMGARMMSASQALRPDLTFAYLLWIGVVGWSLNAVMEFVQKRLLGPAVPLPRSGA